MEDTFDRQARISALLAEAEAVEWTPEWMPECAPECAPGWRPDAGSIPVAGSGAGMGIDADLAAGADGDPDLDDTDPVVRRWRIEQVVALRAQMSRLQALEHRQLAALAQTVEDAVAPGTGGADLEQAMRSLTAELATACRVSTATMQARLGLAHLMVHNFPVTLDALQAGQVESGHVRTITLYGGSITDQADRAEYERLVLERAGQVTPGRLTRYAQLTASRIGKVSFQDRHQRAREARWVHLSDEDNGMAKLTLYVTKLLGTAIWDRLTAQATAIHHDNTNTDADLRTFDQIRTDLACELLLTGATLRRPGRPPSGRFRYSCRGVGGNPGAVAAGSGWGSGGVGRR